MSAQTISTFPSARIGLRTATTTLNDGVEMPMLGLGVFQIPTDGRTASIVTSAIECGYRHFDTAAIYGNERGVGGAIRTCGIPREELFVTTKLWNQDIRSGRYEEAFDESMRRLGLDYVDLYLVHWPITGKIVDAWKHLERLQKSGRVRTIGVSNHMREHLEELLADADVVPAVNQIEFHPYLVSAPLLSYCQDHRIQVEAWSPFMQAGPILKDPTLTGIATRHGKSVAQIIVRWNLQMGVVTIPKSANPNRIRENADVFDFELTPEEVETITALDRSQRSGADPYNFSF